MDRPVRSLESQGLLQLKKGSFEGLLFKDPRTALGLGFRAF